MGSAENLITASWTLSPAWTSPLYLLPKLLLLFSHSQQGSGHWHKEGGAWCLLSTLPLPSAGRTLANPLGSGSKFTLDLGTKHVLTQTQRFKSLTSPLSPIVWTDRPLEKASPDSAQVKGCYCLGAGGRGCSAGGVRICSEIPASFLAGMVPDVCEGLHTPCRCLSLGVLPVCFYAWGPPPSCQLLTFFGLAHLCLFWPTHSIL